MLDDSRSPGTGTEQALTRRQWLETAGLALAAGIPQAAAAATTKTRDAAIHVSLNENAFGPSPRALAAIRDELARAWRYCGDEVARLEAQIAAREGVSPDQIVIGEILDALGFHLALEGGPGGEFIYSEPGYTALVDAVAPAGGVVVGVPLNNLLENDLPAIAGKLNTRTRALYLVNPHNPTGTVSEAGAFKQFVREASKKVTVIVDEAYLEFTSDFAERSIVDLRRANENVVVFRTFGKIYGLAGLAIGYAVAPNSLAEGLKRKGIGLPHSLNRLAVAAATASLDDAPFVSATRQKVTAEREVWNAFFRKHAIRHADARGNFVFFETGRPHHEIAAALKARNIEIARAFAPLDTWARITIGLPHENSRARDAIAALLK